MPTGTKSHEPRVKIGEERLLRARVTEVGEEDDPILVLEIEGLVVWAPVRIRESHTVKADDLASI